ncbi:hypothetical protein BKP37_12670 [Anaerobacillus alkalilacustris]|uniref:DUF2971 domain-containing protein n=1 Tax=Anaerobacillus alkalilacustris TaxID=393763 RepID=A0A1S2LJQ6_9BACI|nr:DUF2971 domain-containing protein [Anaerobacillus alkalilacustris]OIJ12651.1 hypothetical protein BKP37_12670 [Anaerobacillus alkalilacustris]
MNKRGIIKTSDLTPETKLYRYMSLNQFMSFVECKKIYLTKVKKWEDTWEVPGSKLPTLRDDGRLEYPIWEITEIMHGMCFSLNKESDAMWRIYSPFRDGVLIETSVLKIELLQEIQYGFLAPVIYYDDLLEALNNSIENNEYKSPFSQAYLKRRAFEHENEVRLVTVNDEGFIKPKQEDNDFIYLNLEPSDFIENITIDPRADGWYVEMFKKYCNRLNLIDPKKSTLYSGVYEQAKIAMKFLPLDKK